MRLEDNQPQELQPNTQAILLLCAGFGQSHQSEPKPLTLREYNNLACLLREKNLSPGDLLDSTLHDKLSEITKINIDCDRITRLLQRSMMLSLAVEKWASQGLWILSRSDTNYPKCLKQKLRHSAPPLLYGVGNRELLSQGGLAVVGSRDVDSEGLNYTTNVAQICAKEGIHIVSGGARGVDQASMLGALEAGGAAVGVLADSLAKAALASKYRSYLKNGTLALISTYDPNASFNVGNAMGRNKYIYALSNYALVVSSSIGKGGTWAGATEALTKIQDVPVLVRMQGNIPRGNKELLIKGAKPFPEFPWNKPLQELLRQTISEADSADNFQSETKNASEKQEKSEIVTEKVSSQLQSQDHPKNIYEAVLPLILNQLEQPKDHRSLAESLDVQIGQMQAWLKQAVAEGKVIKHSKPVTYQINRNKNLFTK